MRHALFLLLMLWSHFLLIPASQATSAAIIEPDVTEPNEQLLSIILSLKTDVTCFGGDDGLAVVVGLGGLPPYVFVWADGSLGPINANLTAGVHTVTVTDLLGATATFDVTIDQPLELLVDIAAQVDVNCLNASGSATVTTSGGTGQSLVVWSDGQIGPIATNLAAGVYLATATDSKGCLGVKTVTIEADVQLPTVEIDLSANLQLDCLNPTVSLDATASSSGSGISYLWTTLNGNIVAGVNSNLATVDANGNYQLAITNSNNGCTNTQTVAVTADLTLPLVNIQAGLGVDLQIDCLTPELTLDGTGSATGAGIAYLWTTLDGHIVAGANTLDNVIVDASGTYTLTVSNNNNGCTSTQTVNLTADLNLPLVSIAAGLGVDLQIDCLTPEITLDATASSSGSGISYLWTTLDGHIVAGVNSNLATVDAAGAYNLTILNSGNGCSANASVNVTLSLQLPTVIIQAAAQLGCANSSIVLDASASSQGNDFIYLWTTLDGNIVAGANTLTPTVNVEGTYSLLITNILNGCVASGSVIVIGQPGINIQVGSVVDASCFGLLDGSVSLQVTGGAGPYTYLWSNGMTDASVSGLAAGNYQATVTDAQGCQGVVSVNIGQPTEIVASVTTTPASGPGIDDGTASVSVTGGSPAYSYWWSNGMTTASVGGLLAGTYTVTITDAVGCQISVIVVIGNMMNCSLGVTVSAQNTDCNQSNGQATAQPQGGSGAIQYIWSNGLTTATINNLAAGVYVVTISDAQGCTSVGAATIVSIDNTPPVVITQNVTLILGTDCNASLTTNMIDNGSSDACSAITLTLSNYVFDGNQIGNQTIVLTATDQSGNTATGTAVVTVVDDTPPTLVCPANITLNTGAGAVNYAAPTVEDNCAPPPVTLVLTGGFPSGSVFPNGITNVSYAAFGAGGFVATCNFTVTVGGGLVVDFDVTLPSCPGESDGSITVQAMGGTGNYSYLWINANGQTSATATGLSAGVYTVVIVDDAGNVTIQTVTLPDPSGMSISMLVIQDNCDGTGSIDVTVTGGTPPYTYAWYDANGNLFATTEDLDSIPSGTYALVVTDASGCTFSSGIITVNLSTGVDEKVIDPAGTITLSPNPSTDGLITLGLNLPQSSAVQVEIFNMNGQQISTVFEDNKVLKGNIPLNLAGFAPGSYVVKVITAQHTYLKKVILVN